MSEPRPGRAFAVLFPVLVLGSLAVGIAFEHSRPSHSDLPRFDPPPAVELAPVVLPAGTHVLAGRILAETGEGLAGVLVELVQGTEPRWSYTDASGSFAIDGLFEGEVSASLIEPGRPPVVRTASVPGAAVEWTLPNPWPAPRALPEIQRQALYGTVSSPLGAPVEDYEIVFEPDRDSDPLSGVVPRIVPIAGDGGFAVVDLAVGRYQVSILPRWASGGSWPRVATLEYDHGRGVRDLEVVIEAGEIRGHLVEEDGSPLSHALVTVAPLAQRDRVWPPVRTAEDGGFTLRDLPQGEYVVRASAGTAELERRVTVAARRTSPVDFAPLATADPDAR